MRALRNKTDTPAAGVRLTSRALVLTSAACGKMTHGHSYVRSTLAWTSTGATAPPRRAVFYRDLNTSADGGRRAIWLTHVLINYLFIADRTLLRLKIQIRKQF